MSPSGPGRTKVERESWATSASTPISLITLAPSECFLICQTESTLRQLTQLEWITLSIKTANLILSLRKRETTRMHQTKDLTRKEAMEAAVTAQGLVCALNLLDLVTRPARWSRRKCFSEEKQISETDCITLKLIRRLLTI
jgi:hypothetical protein